MLAALVIAITAAAGPLAAQDTTSRKDTTPVVPPIPPAAPAPAPAPPPPPPAPTPEQARFAEGLRTASRGVAQLRNGVDRVTRTQQSGDSVARRRAARRLGGLCGTARSFITSGRPRMQAAAYTDSLRLLAKQLVVRLDSLNAALPNCEKTAGHDVTAVAADLTTRLKAYDDALLAFRTAQAAANKPDSTKTVSQEPAKPR
jgi:hypothetical protein